MKSPTRAKRFKSRVCISLYLLLVPFVHNQHAPRHSTLHKRGVAPHYSRLSCASALSRSLLACVWKQTGNDRKRPRALLDTCLALTEATAQVRGRKCTRVQTRARTRASSINLIAVAITATKNQHARLHSRL